MTAAVFAAGLRMTRTVGRSLAEAVFVEARAVLILMTAPRWRGTISAAPAHRDFVAGPHRRGAIAGIVARN